MWFLLLGLTACLDGSSFTGLSTDICDSPCNFWGTWALQSIDGEALPAVVSKPIEPILVEVTAGSVILNEDSTCSHSISSRQTLNGNVTAETETGACTYAIDGKAHPTLTFGDGTILTGTIDLSEIALTEDGLVFVYRR